MLVHQLFDSGLQEGEVNELCVHNFYQSVLIIEYTVSVREIIQNRRARIREQSEHRNSKSQSQSQSHQHLSQFESQSQSRVGTQARA